ncbi:MAG: FAD-dependent oxidoreductase [Magnetococcales bacterium]|nr:FAD-dependent oxidoreductase [Magnetococcales bacterium]
MVDEYSGPPYDVLILGGGLAGLSAGVSLVQAGLRPLVLEAAKKPGGRARSFYDPVFGEVLDNGPHLLIGAYHSTLKLLKQLGSRDLLLEGGRVNYQFWSREGGWHKLNCPDWPAPLHLLAGVLGFSPLSIKDKLAALGLGTAFLVSRAALENRTVTQWLHAHGQGGQIFQQLWSPLCLAALNEPAGSANAALFAEVLRQAFFRDRSAAKPLLPQAPLTKLIGEPARAFIEKNGGLVLTGQRVKKIALTAKEVVGVSTGMWRFTKPPGVISALPYTSLAALIPRWAESAGFSRLSSAPIVSVHMLYNSPAQLPAPLVGLPFATSQWLFDRSISKNTREGFAPAASGARLSGVMSGAYREVQWSRERLVAAVAEDIASLQPQLPQSRLVAARVIKERRATFSPWPQSSSLRPKAATPWQNMAVAGDWTATDLPATLEGATVSGERAARKILAFFGVDG